MVKLTGSAALVVAVMVFLEAAAAQSPPQFRSGITVTRVDVTVLDKRTRQPVTGLTADDFVIKVDGQSQPIVSLSEVTSPPIAAGRGAFRDAAPDVTTNSLTSPRLFLLIMNDVGEGSPSNRRTGQEIANRFVDRLGPDDLAAVIFVRDNAHAQDFTADRALLRRAIDTYNPSWVAKEVACPLRTVWRAQAALAQMPDLRRAAVFVSPVHDDKCGDVAGDIREIDRRARLDNVPVFTFSAQGLQAPGPEETAKRHLAWRVDLHNEQVRTVAGLTGGRAVVNTNTPAAVVTTIFDELQSYYTIGFEQTYPHDRRRRRIPVQTTRPDAMVVSSRTVFSPREPNASRASSSGEASWTRNGLLEALAAPVPTGDVPLQLATLPLPIAGAKEAGLVLTLGLPPVGSAERFAIGLVAYDGEGRREVLRQTREVNIPGATDGEGTEVTLRLGLQPGRYNLRVSAERLVAKAVGSVAATVVIPDVDREPVSLSGVAVGRVESRRIAGDAVKDLIPLLPTSIRIFDKTDRVGTVLRVHQATRRPPAPAALRTEVLDADGATVLSEDRRLGVEEFAGKGPIEHRFELPLHRLEAGDYLLRFVVTTEKARAQREVRFSVR